MEFYNTGWRMMGMRVEVTAIIIAIMFLAVGFVSMGISMKSDDEIPISSGFSGGDGSKSDPYLISNLTQLQNMSSDMNAYYELVSDIDGSDSKNWNGGKGFDPIGDWSTCFNGGLEGNGHKIRNLHIKRGSEYYVGLFGCTSSNVGISNLTMIDFDIKGDSYTGSISGYVYGTIENCYCKGNISGGITSGGIVGRLYEGKMENCSFRGNVTGTNTIGGITGAVYDDASMKDCRSDVNLNAGSTIGGLCGNNKGRIFNCSSSGIVDGNEFVGGLLGKSEGPLVNFSFSSCQVKGDNVIGGLIGDNWGSVQYCYSSGNVDGKTRTGGLIGDNNREVINCDTFGTIKGTGRVGGLIGEQNYRLVKNCKTYGNVTGSTDVGGILGYFTFEKLLNCTSMGDVKGTSNIGGIVGHSRSGTIQSCYVFGNVSGDRKIGGCTGQHEGTITDVHLINHVSGDREVGGIAGWCFDGSIKQSSFSGNVSGDWSVGGISGTNSAPSNRISIIEDCRAECNLTANSEFGGLVGFFTDELKVKNSFYCINTTNINGENLVAHYGIFEEQFDDWISNNLTFTLDDYFNKIPGTEINAVSNINDLMALLAFSNTELLSFRQTTDINISSLKGFYIPVLRCNYDGGGYNISNINITHPQVSNIGFIGLTERNLFGWQKPAEVTNLTLNNITVNGKSGVGGLIGFNMGNVYNCHVNGKISGVNNVGGLIGETYSQKAISKCSTNVSVSSTGSQVGGMIGYNNNNNLNNCSVKINISGGDKVGGMVGLNSGDVDNCTSEGNINGKNAVGGLIGIQANFNRAENVYMVRFSSSTVNVSGDRSVGGLIGENGYVSYTNNGFESIVYRCSSRGTISGSEKIGGLVGFNTGKIFHSDFFGNISGSSIVGGLVGSNGIDSLNENAEIWFSTSKVSIHHQYGEKFGGLVGLNHGDIYNSNTLSNVTGSEYIGGFVGFNTESISNSSCNGYVRATSYNSGGFLGYSSGNVVDCSAYTEVDGDDRCGGFVGYSRFAYISNCISKGEVESNEESENTGGFVGEIDSCDVLSSFHEGNVIGGENVGGFFGQTVDAFINNSFSIGNVSGLEKIGGLIGYSFSGKMMNSYHSGKVTGTSDIGGLVGSNREAEESGCFWNMEKSGLSTSPLGTGLGDDEMRKQANYLSAGWDFENIWAIGDETSYPFLKQFYSDPRIISEDITTAIEDEEYIVNYTFISTKVPGVDKKGILTLNTNAEWLSLRKGGSLHGIPENDDVGDYWVNVTLTDGLQNIDFHNFTLTVENTNDAPNINMNDTRTILEDEEYLIQYTAIDIDPTNDELAWSIMTNATWMTIEGNTLTGTPGNEHVGIYWINITVSDGRGGLDNRNFTLTVLNVNDDPVIHTKSLPNAIEDNYYHFTPNATDIDPTGDTFVWSMKTDADFLKIDPLSGMISGTPLNDHVGKHWILFNVTDKLGGYMESNLTLIVTGVNDPPVLNVSGLEIDGPEDSEIKLYLSDLFLDIDSTGLSYSGSGTDNITIFIEGDVAYVVPEENWAGEEIIGITASDGEYDITLNITVIIDPVNDPPYDLEVQWNDTYSFEESHLVSASASDDDLEYGDSLLFRWFSNVSGLIGEGEEIDLSLTPGIHIITLNVSDTGGAFIEKKFQVSVSPPIQPSDDDDDDDYSPPADDDDDPIDDGDEKDEGGTSGGIIILIVIIVLILLLIGGAIAFFILKKNNNGDDSPKNGVEDENKKDPESQPVPVNRANVPPGSFQKFNIHQQQQTFNQPTKTEITQPSNSTKKKNQVPQNGIHQIQNQHEAHQSQKL
jgi:flagellar basal body-associated protein FliL